MATGPTTTAADLLETIYEDAMAVAEANMIMPSLVEVHTDRMDASVRRFTQRNQIFATKVNEADDFSSPTKMTKTQIATLTPGESMAQAIIKDRALRTDPTLRADTARELGIAIARDFESDLVGTFSSLNGGEGSTIGSAGTTITWGHVLAAQTQLAASNVGGRYSCVLHPYQMHDLGSSVNLTKDLAALPDSVKDSLANQWYVGSYQLIDFYVSNHIEVDENDDAYGAIFTRPAIALDIRQAPTPENERDASDRSWEMNIVSDFATGTRRADYGIPLLFDATAPTS